MHAYQDDLMDLYRKQDSDHNKLLAELDQLSGRLNNIRNTPQTVVTTLPPHVRKELAGLLDAVDTLTEIAKQQHVMMRAIAVAVGELSLAVDVEVDLPIIARKAPSV